MKYDANKFKPKTLLLKDDGVFPNNEKFPVLIYFKVFTLCGKGGKNIVRKIFQEHDWTNSWDNGIFDYHHYHSNTHEVLGIYSGSATVQLGGEAGEIIELASGDVILIPAGVAHKKLNASEDFKCVGAYDKGKKYDIKKGEPGERPEADENIAGVEFPGMDPVFGMKGPLHDYWKPVLKVAEKTEELHSE
jgi:uncharacterized protein YjlB